MSVYSSISKAGPYVADGSQTEFPYAFYALDSSHVAVFVGVTRVTDGVSISIGEKGGVVSFDAPPPEGRLITILRDVPFTQESVWQNNTAFYPEVIEGSFDKLTMIVQQLSEEFSRCLSVVPGSPYTPEEVIAELYKTQEYAEADANRAEAAAKKAEDALAAGGLSSSLLDDEVPLPPEVTPGESGAVGRFAILKSAADGYIVPYIPLADAVLPGNGYPVTSGAVHDEVEGLRNSIGYGIPIGAIFPFPASVPPEGAYLLNGQTIAGCDELYPKFWEWVQSAGVRAIDNDTYEAELASAGVCGGFVINSATGSVRLPKWKYQAPLGETLPVRGNGMTLGVTDGNISAGIVWSTANSVNRLAVRDGGYGATLPFSGTGASAMTSNSFIGVTTDPDNSGIVAENNAPTDHFVWCIQVYNAATALSEQESAQLASQMQMKAQTDLANVTANIDFAVESWNDGTGGWYRKYRSGWVEQGGIVPEGGSTAVTVNFWVEMLNTKYTPVVTPSSSGGGSMTARASSCYNRTVTTMDVFLIDTSNEGTSWEVKGYAATE